MKEDNYILNLEETEELCRLYWDCQLTPLEEAELQYVLMHSRFDTPLIRETLDFLNMERRIDYQPQCPVLRRFPRPLFVSVAASILICLVAGFIYFITNTRQETEKTILALHRIDSVGSVDPIENKTVSETSETEVILPIAPPNIKKRPDNSPIMDSHHSSDAVSLNTQSNDYKEIVDDEEAIKVFGDIRMRWSKIVDMGNDIRENIIDLHSVEKKIIEKNLKI